MKKFIGIIGLVFLSACAELPVLEGVGGSETANTNFYQHWVHSYEEQGGKKIPNIFRPAGSREFAPADFRMEFAFDPNGQCQYKFLSPAGRHQMRSCVYTKIGKKVYIYDDAGTLLKHLSFTLVEPAGKDRMRFTYGVQAPAAKGKDGKS